MIKVLQNTPKSCDDIRALRTHTKTGEKSSENNEAGDFENSVFEYFRNNEYEIDRTGRAVDGVVIKKVNGIVKEKYVVEVKYVLGWLKACQAQWQINIYENENENENENGNDATGRLVIFNSFNRNWGERPKYLEHSGDYEKGWDLWYRDHSEGYRIDIVKYDPLNKIMHGYPGRLPK